ncbi:MAG: hypothetical protein ACK5LL_14685 [Suipraeoptans sp.]
MKTLNYFERFHMNIVRLLAAALVVIIMTISVTPEFAVFDYSSSITYESDSALVQDIQNIDFDTVIHDISRFVNVVLDFTDSTDIQVVVNNIINAIAAYIFN